MDLPLLTFNFRDQTRIDCISRYWCPNWMKIVPIESPDSQLSIASNENVWGHQYLEIRSIRVWSIFLHLGHFSDSRRSEKWPKKAQKWPKNHFWNSWIYIFCQHVPRCWEYRQSTQRREKRLFLTCHILGSPGGRPSRGPWIIEAFWRKSL